MSADHWSETLSRIAGTDAETIDDVLAEFDPRLESGSDVFPEIAAVVRPQVPMSRAGAVCVGVRVTGPVPDLIDRALRLAAFALERDVEVVVLSHIDECGFERFGFRVERVAGATEAARALCEDQIRRFWNIDLVL